MSLSKPSEATVSVRDAGGDNEVPRDKSGRPRIRVKCQRCDGTGRLPSLKKPGNTVKCTGGCGPDKKDEHKADLPPGVKLVSYTRTTTYIDVLDDKSNVDAWKQRMVLVGVDRDRRILDGVAEMHSDFLALEERARLAEPWQMEEIEEKLKSIKDELNRKAEVAKNIAGSDDKADAGTFKHGLSELVDLGQPLPADVDFGDVIDMDAYRKATRGLKIVHMEKLVVNDALRIGGTPDRVSEWHGEIDGEMWDLIAPDGHVFGPGELIITDLKTGRVDYGALKMAMQLAIYANSELYDHETGERTPLGNINLDWGIIMNVKVGTGKADLYWADLRLGWAAVKVAGEVRAMRSAGNRALKPFSPQRKVSEAEAAA